MNKKLKILILISALSASAFGFYKTAYSANQLSIQQTSYNTSVGDPYVYQSFTAAHNNFSRFEVISHTTGSGNDWTACLTDSFGGSCFANTSCNIDNTDTSNYYGCTLGTPYGTTSGNVYYMKFQNLNYPNNRLRVQSTNVYAGGQLCTDSCYSTYDLAFKIYYDDAYGASSEAPPTIIRDNVIFRDNIIIK